MDSRLKELLNAELAADDQPLIDAGDEWTELLERVDAVRCGEARLAALREVREMVAVEVCDDFDNTSSGRWIARKLDAMIANEERG